MAREVKGTRPYRPKGIRGTTAKGKIGGQRLKRGPATVSRPRPSGAAAGPTLNRYGPGGENPYAGRGMTAKPGTKMRKPGGMTARPGTKMRKPGGMTARPGTKMRKRPGR